MRSTIIAALIAGVLLTCLGSGGTRGQAIKPSVQDEPKLWAAASIDRTVFDPYTFNVGGPDIHLGLVNDDTRVRETGLRESVLMVNGRPIQSERWDMTLKQRLRGDTWEKLRPGEYTVVSCPLWDFIKEPGTYRVSWKGKHFQSPEAVLRIVPR